MKPWIITLLTLVFVVLASGAIYYKLQKHPPFLRDDQYCIDQSTGLKYVCNQILVVTNKSIAKKIASEYGFSISNEIPEMSTYTLTSEEPLDSQKIRDIISKIEKGYHIPVSFDIVMGPSS